MGSQHTNSGAIRVFISYSRLDMEIADRLRRSTVRLPGRSTGATCPRRGMAKELTDFIAGADTVVALVSPAFIASKACNWELGQVKATNKRLVPVVIEPVAIADLPESHRQNPPSARDRGLRSRAPPQGAGQCAEHRPAMDQGAYKARKPRPAMDLAAGGRRRCSCAEVRSPKRKAGRTASPGPRLRQAMKSWS